MGGVFVTRWPHMLYLYCMSEIVVNVLAGLIGIFYIKVLSTELDKMCLCYA